MKRKSKINKLRKITSCREEDLSRPIKILKRQIFKTKQSKSPDLCGCKSAVVHKFWSLPLLERYCGVATF